MVIFKLKHVPESPGSDGGAHPQIFCVKKTGMQFEFPDVIAVGGLRTTL